MKWLKIFAALIIAAVVIFQLASPSATVRYRLTLEADVDGEPATGSSVIEVKKTEVASQRIGIVC
jgi:hypothetical protein